VIFRDGFEAGLQDGTGAIAEPTASRMNMVASPLAVGQSLSSTLPAAAGTRPVDTLVQARAIDGTGFRVERLNLGAEPRVRIVAGERFGVERASAWLQAANGGHVMLGLVGGNGTEAALETAAGEATLQLNSQVQEVYQLHAADGAASVAD